MTLTVKVALLPAPQLKTILRCAFTAASYSRSKISSMLFSKKTGVIDPYELVPGTSLVTKRSEAAMKSRNVLGVLRHQDVTSNLILLKTFTLR